MVISIYVFSFWGLRLPDPTRALPLLPLDPLGDFCPRSRGFVPPKQNFWLRPRLRNPRRHVNEHTNERTNKHDGSQYLLAEVINTFAGGLYIFDQQRNALKMSSSLVYYTCSRLFNTQTRQALLRRAG